MKVILLQELKGKGGEGDVVEVANGYANNYLIPRNIAIVATKGNLKQLEQRKHNIAKREEVRVEKARSTKDVLEGIVIQIEANVGEEGQLFGSITSVMIAEALAKETGLEIDKKRIDLKNPIKTAGEHVVLVSLYRDIKTPVKLMVGASTKEVAAEAEESVKEADVATDETLDEVKEAEKA